jgi:peptide deformylase
MIRPICRDTIILRRKSDPAAKADKSVVDDLMDTLKANSDCCVGMAANMIGVCKQIIVISLGPMNIPMINPVITKKSDPYEAEEGCLSLDGVRKTTRYRSIELKFLDRNFDEKKQMFTGFPAQVIQHEIDHCNGILI